MGHTDGVGKLDLTLVSQSGSYHILGHITCRVSCGTVHLGAVLTGECAAAVTGISAVGVYNDLTAGQSAVAVRSADHETACGVDKELRVLVHHILPEGSGSNTYFLISSWICSWVTCIIVLGG